MNQLLRWRGWLLLLGGLLSGPTAQAQAPAPVWQGVLPVAGSTVAVPGPSGDVYVTGVFSGRQSFGTFSLTSVGEKAIFVARWSGRTHRYLWARQAAGAVSGGAPALAVVGTSVYLAGMFEDSIRFGKTRLVGRSALFVAKLTDAGAASRFVWAQQSRGTGFLEVSALAASGANVYVVGSFRDTISLGETQLTAAGVGDGFVARLTDEGATSRSAWAVRAGGAGEDELNDVAVVGNKVYVAGAVTDQAICGGIHLSREGAGTDLLVARLDDVGPATTFTWAERLRHAAHSWATSLLASADTLYVAGECGYAPGLGLTEQAHNPIGVATLLKLRDTGATVRVVWAETIAGNQSASWFIQGRRGNSLYIIGSFDDVLYLDRHKVTASSPERALFIASIRDEGEYGNCAWLRQFSATPRPLYWAGCAVTGGGLLYLALGTEDIILHDRQGHHLRLGPLPPPRGLLLPTGRQSPPRRP